MITVANHMQSYENHQRKRKSKSNACLHVLRFGRFTRFNYWTQDTINRIFIHSGRFSRGISHHLQIHQNQSKFIQMHKIHKKSMHFMIIGTNRMKFDENNQLKRKSKSNSFLHILGLLVSHV